MIIVNLLDKLMIYLQRSRENVLFGTGLCNACDECQGGRLL